MTDKEKIFEILKTYVKKNGITASVVILEEYAEELSKNGLVFSKELSDENERLKAVSEAELDTIHNLGEDYEKALEEINRLNERDKKSERIIELADKTIKAQSAEIERYLHSIKLLEKDVQTAKSEAYKECLTKVKKYIKTNCNPYGKPKFDYDTSIKILNYIDNLSKELVGDDNA